MEITNRNISHLIKILQEIQEKEGDLPVGILVEEEENHDGEIVTDTNLEFPYVEIIDKKAVLGQFYKTYI